mgnify:CR=1 FL=1
MRTGEVTMIFAAIHPIPVVVVKIVVDFPFLFKYDTSSFS